MIMKQKITFILALYLIGGLRRIAVEVSTFADFKACSRGGGVCLWLLLTWKMLH